MLLASDGGTEGPVIWAPFFESLVDPVRLGASNTLMAAISSSSLSGWGMEGCAYETVWS